MEPLVTVTAGALRGRAADGVRRFLGVPYAAPPVGALRYAAPRPPAPWSGVRDAGAFGPTAPKPAAPDVFEALLPDPDLPGEDCLTVNVWTPADGEGLPVFVWVHGGGYATGSGSVPVYDGSAFARDGVVCVTLNYRLGVEGFAVLDDAPHNRGLLDVVAALQWVREEIVAFGGDPARVTIGGESAGAMAVTTLATMPAARGLFTRLVAQSGAGHHCLDLGTARRVSAAVCAELGVATSAAALADVPVERVLAAAAAVTDRIAADTADAWAGVHRVVMALQPVVDGTSLPQRPIDAIGDGVAADLDVLIGTNAHEFTLWTVPTGLADVVDDSGVAAAVERVGVPASVLDAYRHADPGVPPADLLARAVTDWAFRVPAVRVAEARARATHVYEFTYASPLFDGRLGATHALELPFVFDTLGQEWGRAIRGEDAPQALAGQMHAAWVAFVRDGDPGWPAYGTRRTVRVFGDVPPSAAGEPPATGAGAGCVDDPRGALRAAWDGLR